MPTIFTTLFLSVLTTSCSTTVAEGETGLTIYNQGFAVVREAVPLDLRPGTNEVVHSGITAHLEPDSVILRDPTGALELTILEQNYRADPVSQGLLLSHFEGQTIPFELWRDNEVKIVQGRIVRSGYVPHTAAYSRYGQQYYQAQMAYSQGNQPIIEIDGRLRFGLPGLPLFPELADDSILKPTLDWLIQANEAGTIEAELGYVTGGLGWEADYNLVAPVEGDQVDLVGWVTMDNQCGKDFLDARIKLMAGDVNKIRADDPYAARSSSDMYLGAAEMAGAVTERAFDDLHLYTLRRKTTLRDRQTKQVEFVRGNDVSTERIYVYDGAQIGSNYRGWSAENIRDNRDYGTISNGKVWIMREFMNSEENGLGLPLPRGRLRFYRQDDDGSLQFTGENVIDHTPKDELVRVYTGNAFDIVGERKRTDYRIDHDADWLDETFEIDLRNHKEEPVEIRVVEHLYRWVNWDIRGTDDAFVKKDSQTIEFAVTVPPDGAVQVKYTVHYSW